MNDDSNLDSDALRAAQFSSISSGLNGALDSFAVSAKKKRQLFLAFVLFVVLNVIDQLTKQIARTELSNFEERSYLGGILRLHHSENPGAFLSLGAQLSPQARTAIFTGLVGLFLLWALWMTVRKAGHANYAFVLGWAMLITGGFGNVIDRVWKSSVTDFMVMGVGPLQTGVFNVADMAILFGIFIVIIWGRETPPSRVGHSR